MNILEINEITSSDWIGSEITISSNYTGDIERTKSQINRIVISHGKICSCCWTVLETERFYKKGDRRDSKCRQCLLQDKRKRRIKKKSTKKRLPRGRVLDIDSFSTSITPITQVDSSAADSSYRQWIDFTLGD